MVLPGVKKSDIKTVGAFPRDRPVVCLSHFVPSLWRASACFETPPAGHVSPASASAVRQLHPGMEHGGAQGEICVKRRRSTAMALRWAAARSPPLASYPIRVRPIFQAMYDTAGSAKTIAESKVRRAAGDNVVPSPLHFRNDGGAYPASSALLPSATPPQGPYRCRHCE